MQSTLVFRFASARTANRLVAGIPASARLARAFSEARSGGPLVLVLAGDGRLSLLALAEIARLAPGLAIEVRNDVQGEKKAQLVPGETLPDAAAIAAWLAGAVPIHDAVSDPDAALIRAGRAIIRATAKPGDGIVSRIFNRPLSQAASAVFLCWAWVRPGHATALTAVAALAMLACLLALPSPTGLVAGAVLFQLASVIDGVDGEIARATFRTSKRGASYDSLIDAATNCAFLGGAGCSFALQGQIIAACIGWAAMTVQLIGLTILGRAALARDGFLHFEGAKAAVNQSHPSASGWLKDLSSRDFYCAFLLVTAIAGFLQAGLALFLVASLIWLSFVFRSIVWNDSEGR